MARKKSTLSLVKRLVLNRYLLNLFGAEQFEDLSIFVNKTENEGLTEERTSKFHHAIVGARLEGAKLNEETLLAYDRNIVSHTLAIQGKRSEPIRWKYFQYLALLFTEIYLERYMNDRKRFLESLNTYCGVFNGELDVGDRVSAFTEDDLRKVAFWSATGSGKTLIMHMNIKQYLHYLTKSGRERELNRILLVTPNEGLSRQHLEEFEISGMRADLFSKQSGSLLAGTMVEIIEITKLAESDGDETVALESFEDKNLVLVDEGHRGSSGKVWSTRRRILAEKGFTFEYSATLGQAASGNEALTQEYAKSILFDYSYRYFYKDGFGKNYRILNFTDDEDTATRELYLTACLLTFYQQKILFKNPKSKVKSFNIENPLWVFVGGSVTKSTSSKDISDTIDILLFLARFTSPAHEQAVLQRIEKAISGDTGLLSSEGEDIFANMFPHISNSRKTATEIYKDILRDVFNADVNAALHVENLKGADGEIALRLGDYEPFGVINVGDASKLCSLCGDQDLLTVTEKNFTDSLFHGINKEDSHINILIGSKKFTEGWNSWRVSTMGLMNVGRKEGSQIIQLFGRGVRLKGYKNMLKRHRALPGQRMNPNPYLTQLETLNIFGIRADYMREFRKYLEEEGVPEEDTIEEIVIRVIPNLGKPVPPRPDMASTGEITSDFGEASMPHSSLDMHDTEFTSNFEKKDPEATSTDIMLNTEFIHDLESLKLKNIRVRKGLNYKHSGKKPVLRLREKLTINKVILDYYPRIQMQIAKGIQESNAKAMKDKGHLSAEHIEFLDMDAIYFDLHTFKNERGWFNLTIEKAQLIPILSDKSWYEILIPEEQLKFDDFTKVNLWQSIATNLIQKYCDRYYKASKNEWEAPHREYYNLDSSDPNFISKYKIFIDKSKVQIINRIKEIKDKVESDQIPNDDINFGQNISLFFGRHLYRPLLYLANSKNGDIQIEPVALNKGERTFIENLRTFYSQNEPSFEDKNIYLLRNMSRGRGIGFFEADNFYPDFLLWLLDGNKQYISFVDPKGLVNLEPGSSKIDFYSTIKDIQKNLGDENVILNSFIVSVTPHASIEARYGSKDGLNKKHILFQEDANYIEQLFTSMQATN